MKDVDDRTATNIKETLESILVAFILAFIFRCFVVEAFVIPTGSMAPTLMGAHTTHVCPECGYKFTVDFHSRTADADEDAETPQFAGPYLDHGQWFDEYYSNIRCPNCGYKFPLFKNPPVSYGDRILVLKYAYLLAKPKRWDVVVFKTPVGPIKRFEMNYIKRLIGLPGETIMVLDGDVYVKAAGTSEFIVQPKTREAQDAMWRIIYDDDYRPINSPQRQDKWVQPWQLAFGAGWSDQLAGNRRGFAFDNATGSGTLRFNADPETRGSNVGFMDWLAYDQSRIPLGDRPYYDRSYEGKCTVSDLKLDFFYSRKAGDGPLKVETSKLNDRFILELLRDRAILHHESHGREVLPAKTASLPELAGGEHHFEFSNADYRVTLRIDGKDIFQTTPAEYRPDIDDLISRTKVSNRGETYLTYRGDGSGVAQRGQPFPEPVVQIEANRQSCTLSHVSLWRDVYYTPESSGGQIIWGNPVATSGDTGPVKLGQGEYFVMGDNSPMSFDARFWNEPVDLPRERLYAKGGRVPERFMLGRAFFVYWPAGFRPSDKSPALIPNFGDMRFIR